MDDFLEGRTDAGGLWPCIRQWVAEGNGPGSGEVRLQRYLGFDDAQWERYLEHDELPERGSP